MAIISSFITDIISRECPLPLYTKVSRPTYSYQVFPPVIGLIPKMHANVWEYYEKKKKKNLFVFINFSFIPDICFLFETVPSHLTHVNLSIQ